MPRKQINKEPFLKVKNKKKKEQKIEKRSKYGKYTKKHIRLTLEKLKTKQ